MPSNAGTWDADTATERRDPTYPPVPSPFPHASPEGGEVLGIKPNAPYANAPDDDTER
jgi:hypothetical protein